MCARKRHRPTLQLALAFILMLSRCTSTGVEVIDKRQKALPPDSQVIGAVLADLVKSIGDKYLVVTSETRAPSIDSAWVTDHLRAEGKPNLVPSLDEMILDYRARNSASHILPADLVSARIRVATLRELHRIFERGELQGGGLSFGGHFQGRLLWSSSASLATHWTDRWRS